ncbi:hypothetical protein C4573_00295 [Candidatus Woesearchaeota archaeon]|nr:MAG: hypothetical protein C4573_00295 [Candidatus Woesearchaeota archaeon]
MKYATLSSGFMLTSMLGFLISVLYVYKMDESWGVAFSLIFILMFIASIISMTKAPVADETAYQHLAVHEKAMRNKVLLRKK